MDILDIALSLFYFVVIFAIGLFVRSQFSDSFIYKKYFLKGLVVKLLGGMSFALVYTFYYTYGGDTKSYFKDSEILTGHFFESPLAFIQILFASDEGLWANHADIVSSLGFRLGTSEWFMVKGTSMVGILGFNNYYSTTLVFAALSYFGIWKLFTVLYRRYPKAHRPLAFSILFVPSVFFWGSGVMKDCVVIGFLGLLMYHVDLLITNRTARRWLSIPVIAIITYIIFNIKAYVVVSLLPAIIIWVIMNIRDQIQSKLIRYMLLPLLISSSIVFVVLGLNFIGQYTDKYNVDNVLTTAEGMQTWHYVEGHNTSDENGRGSSYTLGDYEPTIAGTAKMFFPAVNVTFFRPYLWEVKNIAMLAAAIESTIVFLFTLFIFLGLGFFRVLKILNNDAFLLMALSFALFFGFAVGFTSYNFGALVRYKIPCMPFFLASLFILRHKVNEVKDAKKNFWKKRRLEAQSISSKRISTQQFR